MTTGYVPSLHTAINAQPNFEMERYTSRWNIAWDTEPTQHNGFERWKELQRDNAELKLTPSKTFWLTVFLSKGKTIEAYHGHHSTEQNHCRLV